MTAVTITMSPEEYDDYRAYQKDKSSFENKANAKYRELQNELESISTSLLNAVTERNDSTEDNPRFDIVQPGHLADAYDMARETFA